MVFEASSIQQQQHEQNHLPQAENQSLQQRSSVYSSGGSKTHIDPHQPLSFAAVAAAKNKAQSVQAPPAYAQQSNLEQSHQLQQSPASTSKHLNDHMNQALDSPPSPASQCSFL